MGRLRDLSATAVAELRRASKDDPLPLVLTCSSTPASAEDAAVALLNISISAHRLGSRRCRRISNLGLLTD